MATPTVTVTDVTGGKKVTASTSTAGAVLHYTDDGTTPTGASAVLSNSGKTYSSATDKTIKVIAVKDGWSDSEVASENVEVIALEAPVVTPEVNSFTMTGPDGATLHYTIDGTTPKSTSPTYTEAVTIIATVTVKAIAMKSGNANSTVTSQEVTYA